MLKLSEIQLKVFHVLLLLFIIFFFIPLIILISQSLTRLDNVKNLSNETSKIIVEDQTAQICKSEAENIAKSISSFLSSCEIDLEILTQIPKTAESYLDYSKSTMRYLNSQKMKKPLYKEISFIDKNGQEVIKIKDNRIIPPEQLKDVSIPENTTYRKETYFEETKSGSSDIYVSHLNGWYVNRQEQMTQNKPYNGIYRFCKRRIDTNGNFDGIYMIALDHLFIMDFVWQEPDENSSTINIYREGNYNYLFDDEGWIIVHPKLWDIRGFDKEGNLVESLSKDTPKWKIDAGLIPINFFNMDFRLRDFYTDEPMSSIVKRVQRGETAVYTMPSSGIYGDTEGIIRTRACAPIVYSTGNYVKHGIWGGVVVGKAMENLLEKTKNFTTEVESISKNTKTHMIFLFAIISFAVFFFSFLLARYIARTMLKLNDSLIQIGHGDKIELDVNSPIKEISEVNAGVKRLSVELREKEKEIKQYIKDLEVVNIKLGNAQKELDSYWKHEYEIESDHILVEKIELYEKDYPKLKDIRINVCIGNSPEFLRVLRRIVPLSQMTIPAWIYGESGVGKTALGRTMHLLSPRRNKPFHVFEAVEFSAADPMIVLGKLFGYGPGHGLRSIPTKGQKGIFEDCDGGTLLIDEVEALPMETQAQLLRVVDGLYFHPAAGKIRNITADIRFIFVSNVDIEQRVKEGLFRKDLFRRMGGSINKIEIPPLRKRKLDIVPLIDFFISRYKEKHGIKLEMGEDAIKLLHNCDYREGNIGELRMIIELASESARIDGEDIILKTHLPPISINNNIPVIDKKNESNIFSEKEFNELSVLRKNHFHMEMSENELGYKQGSRTLSHHLRGMCYKAFIIKNQDMDASISLISGNSGLPGKIEKNIQIKMNGYIKNISEKLKQSQETLLFNNLPKEYHNYLLKIVEELKRSAE